MASKTLLAIALAVETCVGMDDFFMPPYPVIPQTFPLESTITQFSFELEARSSPARVPTLKYVVRASGAHQGEYLIWLQNYHLASVQACQKAIVFAIRDMANNRTLRMSQLDATTFL